MGDLRVLPQRPDVLVMADRPPMLSPSLDPDPSSIGEDVWAVAEKTTQEVIRCIQPTMDSEERRTDIIEYVQRLIRSSLGHEVFPYGSVPLKTYLPDGDIDLTANCSPGAEDTLPHNVCAVLLAEQQNEDAEYGVKDIQFIDAEVKLVKCLVQNIVIDISFNQLGGLCTLCFLELVDRLVGKDHLFKRSIILIKAWCYYESRILGAHHGLISTYALETLVLYIFHLFHRSLNGPLAVLYRFLDYFNKFDWDNYCVSLKGPILKSALPNIVVEKPANCRNDLMLSEDFLRNCMDMFSVPSRLLDTNFRAFPPKYLNIVDPLKENNNLGRSVNRGNFHRIRSAFKLGARRLGKIFLGPSEEVADEIKKFLANTLQRHGGKSYTWSTSSHSRSFTEDTFSADFSDNISGLEDPELERDWMKISPLQTASKHAYCTDDIIISGLYVAGDTGWRVASSESDCSPSSCDLSNSPSGPCHLAPHSYFSGSSMENGKFENGALSESNPAYCLHENIGSMPWLDDCENHLEDINAASSCTNNDEGVGSIDSGISSPNASLSESLVLDFRERDLNDIAGSPETLNPLSDLSGDYDSDIRNLLYGQCCHGNGISAPVWSNHQSPLQLPNKSPDVAPQSILCKQNLFSQIDTNNLVLGSMVNTWDNPTSPTHLFGLEENHRPRGTGLFYPYSSCSVRERPSPGRRRNHTLVNQRQFRRHSPDNSAPALPEKKSSVDALPWAESALPVCRNPGLAHQSNSLFSAESHINSFSISSMNIEFGSLGHLPVETSLLASGSTKTLETTEMKSPKTALSNNQERVVEKSYCLKNEDFPPLATEYLGVLVDPSTRMKR